VIIGKSTPPAASPELQVTVGILTTEPASLPVKVSTEENSNTVHLPLLSTEKCEGHSADLMLVASTPTIQIGQDLTITAVLSNTGCVALGIPQYRLVVEPAGVLTFTSPSVTSHSLAVAVGGEDRADFTLRAESAGQAVFNSTASFEVHIGYPGPAYWGMAASQPVTVTVISP
jgi:hypothetical protein